MVEGTPCAVAELKDSLPRPASSITVLWNLCTWDAFRNDEPVGAWNRWEATSNC